MKNQKSIRLIKDFTNEYLRSDINKLSTFDIKQLQGNKKYGGCNGGGFDCDNTNIVRAILAVVFEGVWPDFDEDALTRKEYRGDTINTFNTMFGPRTENGGFQGFNIFYPKNDLFNRVERFYHTYTTIGNFIPLPNKYVGRYTLNTFRGTYSKWRDFFDQFLLPIITTDDDAEAKRQYKSANQRVNNALKKLGEKLGLPIKLTTYVARHSWATAAQKKNISLSTISRCMGHKSEEMTSVYLASIDTSDMDDANKLSGPWDCRARQSHVEQNVEL